MKRFIFPFYVFVLMLVVIGATSCNRSYESFRETETVHYEYGSKSFSEIALNIEYSYSERVPADLKVSVSNNFKIEQFSSVYNKEQNLSYFSMTCKGTNATGTYFISGVLNIKTKEAVISYAR